MPKSKKKKGKPGVYCAGDPKAKPVELGDLDTCLYCNEKATTAHPVGGDKKCYQVHCPKCGMVGPKAKTARLAGDRWNSLPKGRPPIYERIKSRCLDLIDKELAAYEKVSGGLDANDCIAIAKMLEASTMCVDTWEM